ncbi:hypothetical protein PTSG_06192 [Salpingoeca rosetta]|uniref:Uncharacterized protein n=1 Tax=Salpingoeca rosetta (strain ATCC 50818 / BSB-021) TaxID=946362 RepID=F2UC77_SALR5|nr:uncharacterized protein PTSG_06192 [Salpingoeca rosetta]EGD74184.1 hypothetical protein PTSG_06192 [Salpingoeca rosetta]|eukprot:XP_004993084.1 hypothetical protein PTSG_06192 [Salpingoeca rosetta]
MMRGRRRGLGVRTRTSVGSVLAVRLQGFRPSSPRGSGTLHDFFGGTDHSVPTFFLLDFPRKRARFVRQLPANTYVLKSSIKWHGKQLQLCSRHPLPSKEDSAQIPRSSYPDHAVSILKSHLQKCVRRQRAELVASTMRELMALAMFDLLRRLPIIVIEDVCLHQQFPVLVWLMAAVSKGADLSAEMLDWLVSFAAMLANCPHRDDSAMFPDSAEAFDVQKISKELKNEEQKSLLYSMQLRRSFGGMSCDGAMMDKMTRVWLRRFKVDPDMTTCRPALSTPLPSLSLKATPPLNRAKWELAAVDFHCSGVVDSLKATHPEMGEGEIKQLMWDCSSGINTRTRRSFDEAGQETAQHKPTTHNKKDARADDDDDDDNDNDVDYGSTTTTTASEHEAELKVWRTLLQSTARAFAQRLIARL